MHPPFTNCSTTSTFPCYLAYTYIHFAMMEGMVKSHQVPAFGYWDYCDELPVTQCFESAVQAELIRGHSLGEDGDDLSKVSDPARPAHHHHYRKVNKVDDGVGGEKQYGKEVQRKQGRVSFGLTPPQNAPRSRAPKAVDEDLYKVPPELIYLKPKKKRLLKNLWSGCMGLNS